MNGNSYVIIQENNAQQIEEQYIKAIQEGIEEIPTEYVNQWIERHLQGE